MLSIVHTTRIASLGSTIRHAFLRSTPLGAAAGAATLLTGCLCPPCAQGPATAAAPNSTEAAPTAAAPAASAPAASGAKEVIWNGDDVTRGKSWANCDKAGECKATLAPAPGSGARGSNGLVLHGEGSGWQGGGWNWFGWWPENGGTDLSGYDDLVFTVKISAPAKDKGPNASGINLALGCSLDKKSSADASLGKYAANAGDGQWHEVRIPLKDFFSGKGAECDSRTAWEFRVGSWSGTPVAFDLVLDDISVVKN